jgi:hypothetical protein
MNAAIDESDDGLMLLGAGATGMDLHPMMGSNGLDKGY